MPITPTEKIWLDGELVAWEDARIHVLTHSLHYGSGVFEGCTAIASARSSLFGRAPVAKDIEVALTLFGYLGEPPADLVSWRSTCFKSAAHEYSIRRMLVSMVPERTLRLSPIEVSGSISDWKSMLEIPEGEA